MECASSICRYVEMQNFVEKFCTVFVLFPQGGFFVSVLV